MFRRSWKPLGQIIVGIVVTLLLSGFTFGSGSRVIAEDPAVIAGDPAGGQFHCKGGAGEGMPVGSGHGGCDGGDPFCGPGYED